MLKDLADKYIIKMHAQRLTDDAHVGVATTAVMHTMIQTQVTSDVARGRALRGEATLKKGSKDVAAPLHKNVRLLCENEMFWRILALF